MNSAEFSQEIEKVLTQKLSGEHITNHSFVIKDKRVTISSIIDIVKSSFPDREIKFVQDDLYHGKDTGLVDTSTIMLKVTDTKSNAVTAIVVTVVGYLFFTVNTTFIQIIAK